MGDEPEPAVNEKPKQYSCQIGQMERRYDIEFTQLILLPQKNIHFFKDRK